MAVAQLPQGFVLDQPEQIAIEGSAQAGGLPPGFVIDEPQSVQPEQTTEQPQEPEEAGFFESIGEMFTGSERMTPTMESIEEIGAAPELNEMSMAAFKTSLGLLATGDTEKAKGVIQQNIPSAEFTEDEKGNVIVNLPSGQYALNKPGTSAQDIVRGAFSIAAFTPAGRAATLPAAAGGAALTEAAIQGVAAGVGGGQVDIGEVALAGALGGGGKVLEDVISTGYRAAKGKITGPEKEIIEAGKAADVPVLTTDVIAPETFVGKSVRSVGEKIPLAGTGAKRAKQQEAREVATEKFVDKFQEPSYKEIVESIKAKSSGIKKAAGSVLEKTGKKLDEAGDISVIQTRGSIDDALAELSKPNVRPDAAAIEELTTLKELMDMPQTFTSLKENRTIARDILDSFGKGERSQLPGRSKSLIQKSVNAMGKDMDEMAKGNLTPKEYSQWKRANAVYAEEATKLKKTKIKNILDKGDVTPENVSTMLFSKKPSEVQTLYSSLTTEGKQNARSALIYKAFDNAQKRAGGLTPSVFSSELNKIAKNTDVFFRGKDKKQLEGFKRLIDATRQAQAAAVETKSGQQLIPYATGAAAITDLGATLLGGGTVGGLTRLYESAAVRNALLRLASVPKGSDKYLKALSDAQAALTASAQAARSGE